MSREIKRVVRPSIFTDRYNSTSKLDDEYEYVTINSEELHQYGGSRDKDGKIWYLNSIKAVETGEYLRHPRFWSWDIERATL